MYTQRTIVLSVDNSSQHNVTNFVNKQLNYSRGDSIAAEPLVIIKI